MPDMHMCVCVCVCVCALDLCEAEAGVLVGGSYVVCCVSLMVGYWVIVKCMVHGAWCMVHGG